MTDTASIADRLRASVEHASTKEPLSIRIPIFDDPKAYMSLRQIKDLATIEEASEGLDSIPDELTRNLNGTARLLGAACTEVYVVDNGERVTLGSLEDAFAQIFPDSPTPPDAGAIIFAFYTDTTGERDEVQLGMDASRYDQWRQGNYIEAQEQVAGE